MAVANMTSESRFGSCTGIGDVINSGFSSYHQFSVLTSEIPQSVQTRRHIAGAERTLANDISLKSNTRDESSHVPFQHRLLKTGNDSLQR
jgi:hypothetical protein